MVRLAGLEPVRLAAPDPKSGASTNFATGATNAWGTLPCPVPAFKAKQAAFSLTLIGSFL